MAQRIPTIPLPRDAMEANARMLRELISILEELEVEHVLIGGLAAGLHGRVRATVDVDLLVPGKKLRAIERSLKTRGYVVRRSADMLRAYAKGADPSSDEAFADLVNRDANAVSKNAFRASTPATVLGKTVRTVNRGAFVALKFHAAISPRRRQPDRHMDLADLGRVIEKTFTAADEAEALAVIKPAFPGAEAELAKLIEDFRNGRPVKI